MRKIGVTIIFSLVFWGLVGWSIYEFAFSSNETDSNQLVSEEAEQNEFDLLFDETSEEELLEQEPIELEDGVGLEIGDLAPDFKLTRLTGEDVSLSDYRGRPVMLNFWATWCPPCRAEMPDMEQFYRDEDVEILAVNLADTERSIDDVYQFADEYDLSFPILLDESIEVAMTYEIQPIPTSFMIDSEGVIQFKTYGPLTYDQMVEVQDDMN